MNATESLPSPLMLSVVHTEPEVIKETPERVNFKSSEEIEDLRRLISEKIAVITVQDAPHFTRPGETQPPREELLQQLDELLEKGITAFIIEGEKENRRFPDVQDQLDSIWIAQMWRQKNRSKNSLLRVIGGTEADTSKEQERIPREGFGMGLDATLLLAPSQLSQDPEALKNHLQKNLNKGPGLLHSDKQKSGFSIPLDVILELKDHPNFLGVVERDSAARVQQLLNAGIHVWVKKFPETTILFQQENPLLHEIT